MNIGTNKRSNGVVRGDTLSATSDNTAIVASLGYRPKRVVAINLTDVVRIEKIDGMTNAQTLQEVAAGTQTVQTGSQIVLSDTGFTLSAAAAGNAKSWVFFVQ